MKTQCTHCRGDYTVSKDGQLRKHDCRRFHTATGEWTYGPRDAKGRGAEAVKGQASAEAREYFSFKLKARVIAEQGPEAFQTESVEAKKEESVTNSNITPEMIEALRTLRNTNLNHYGPLWRALNVLDNAGVFHEIDEATGYDVDTACTCPDTDYRKATGNHHAECSEAPVSKCTCPELSSRTGVHLHGCPGDPAEWGDMAFTSPTA